MRAVIALALLALVGAQIVAAGIIYQQPYTADYINHPENFFCNGSAISLQYVKNYTAGECQNTADNSTSSAYYCDNDGVIRIGYSYGFCGTANATTMSRTPNVCGAGATNAKWVCSGKDALPSGLAWPPTGQWAQSTIQFNNTFDGTANSPSAGACGTLPASARAVNVQSAQYVGCTTSTQANSFTQASSVQYFTGGWSGSYAGANCQTLVSLTQGFGSATCKNGVTSTGVPDGNNPPGTPSNVNSITATRTYFEKSGSTLCGNKLATTYFTNLCLNGFKVECNNSIYTETKYNLVDGSNGLCSGTLATGYPAVKNQSTAACDQIGVADNGYQYSCSAGGNGGNSAATASFSVVVLVIAAFVALLSQ